MLEVDMSGNYTQLSEEKIKQMSLADLKSYSFTVSTVIAEKTADIQKVKDVQSQYEYLILNSESTITAYNYEILQTDNAIMAKTVQKKKIQDQNIEYDSTIRFYTARVDEQNKIIDDSVLNISSLTRESSELDKYIEETNSVYVSSAVGYSSLYMVYTAKDIIYQKCVKDINETRVGLSNSIIQEAVSFKMFEDSTQAVQKKRKEVEDIYLEGTQIQSTLSEYKIQETNLAAALVSTNVGIAALSSLYETAVLNQEYYQLLSTQSGFMGSVTTAKVVYETALSRSQADPLNTSLQTATSMAQQRLSAVNTTKIQADVRVTAAQKIVNGATNDSYAISLAAAEGAIQLELQNSSTFQGYKDFSIRQVTYFSTLYEKAGRDIVSSIGVVETYNKFYNSSIAGSNALMTIINNDISSIAGEQATIDALSLTISSLYNQHSEYTSTYSGHMVYSSLMKKKIQDATANISLYTSLYASTSAEVSVKSKRLEDTERAITNNITEINTMSSILEMEKINVMKYQRDVAASFNMEELSAYKYRETFVRLKKAEAQRYYEACVLDQVQKTSTQNAKLKLQAGNTPFTLTPININTESINLAYTNITTIDSFLNTFSDIYTNYSIQNLNLDAMSTSINNKQNEYSSFVAYSNRLRIDPTNDTLIQTVLASRTSLTNIDYTTNKNLNNIELTQKQINTAKDKFLVTYRNIFFYNEIIENENVISSFLMKGFNSAVF
jgi:hypothetical protein